MSKRFRTSIAIVFFVSARIGLFIPSSKARVNLARTSGD